ncbi:MAG: cupredoxin domain-containing protein [bacterium]|nr:cupredoxin domain-containing protein [bacterium]
MKSRLPFVISVTVILLVACYMFYATIIIKNTSIQSSKDLQLFIDIAGITQTASNEVVIQSVTLPKKGFAVVRMIEGERLSQVVEISKILEPGTHKYIKISWDEELVDVGETELIVLLYKDNGDLFFNDTDQPITDKNGNMIARYVKTGELVPLAILKPDSSTAGHSMGDMPTVRYTNTGYEPSVLEVPVGVMVKFINDSDENMWVASNEHPGHGMLPTFDQFSFGKKGSNYTYVFDKKGTWPFHDHINPEREGVIIVN